MGTTPRRDSTSSNLAVDQLDPLPKALWIAGGSAPSARSRSSTTGSSRAGQVGRRPVGLFAPLTVDALAVVVELRGGAQQPVTQLVAFARQRLAVVGPVRPPQRPPGAARSLRREGPVSVRRRADFVGRRRRRRVLRSGHLVRRPPVRNSTSNRAFGRRGAGHPWSRALLVDAGPCRLSHRSWPEERPAAHSGRRSTYPRRPAGRPPPPRCRRPRSPASNASWSGRSRQPHPRTGCPRRGPRPG